MKSSPHLSEAFLFECYLARQAGQPLDPPAAEHLADCAACAAVFNGFVSALGTIRAEGTAEADRVFTAERLRAQHESIARRLQHVGRSARVISFPGRAAEDGRAPTAARTAPRWVAAAAAAGLFVGVALGASYQWEVRAHGPSSVRMARAATLPAATHASTIATRGLGPAPSASDEDAFLSDLEVALARPQTRELQPFDALTPHVRDVRTDLRGPAR